MSLLQRASKLLTANVNHLLDNAEDSEVMLKQLIRDMDASIVELRRETVNAVARQKQLDRKRLAAGDAAVELEKKALLALDHQDEKLARRILGERVEVLKTREILAEELRGATALATQLKADLNRMEKQAQMARRKKHELIRRKRAAEAQLRTQEASRRSVEAMSVATGRVSELHADQAAFGGYADEISQMEARAEAARELSDAETEDDFALSKLVEASEVDEELERLKRERASNE